MSEIAQDEFSSIFRASLRSRSHTTLEFFVTATNNAATADSPAASRFVVEEFLMALAESLYDFRDGSNSCGFCTLSARRCQATGNENQFISIMPAPKVKPPPNAHSPKRSPVCAVGNTSCRHSGILLEDVFPYLRMLLYTRELTRF